MLFAIRLNSLAVKLQYIKEIQNTEKNMAFTLGSTFIIFLSLLFLKSSPEASSAITS